MSIIPVRVCFQKTGRLKYISHLDTMEFLKKVISRSKLPVWYTEGFNPHIYLTICLPLSLGYEGQRECFDIRLTEEVPLEEVEKRLNKFLPTEMKIFDVKNPILDANSIGWADYTIEMYYPSNAGDATESFESYSKQSSILVDKKSKKGLKSVDILPYIKNIKFSQDNDYLKINVRLATGSEFNVNPRLLWQSFAKYFGNEPEGVSVTRNIILDEQEEEFR